MRSYTLILSVMSLTAVLMGPSCKGDKKTEHGLMEGVIEYNASVVDESHPMAGLAPSTATVKFKGNKFELEMSTMGIFNIMFVSNPSQRTLTQMVKLLDIKNACVQGEAELVTENKDYELKFEESQEVKKIAGYPCKKVKATMTGRPDVSFDIYYTEDLGSDSINFLSPYRAIKGMLMQYRLKKLGLEMCFTATSVKKEEVSDDTFEVPAHYKMVSRDEMEQLFADFQK